LGIPKHLCYSACESATVFARDRVKRSLHAVRNLLFSFRKDAENAQTNAIISPIDESVA
jgi:hypothetical protein